MQLAIVMLIKRQEKIDFNHSNLHYLHLSGDNSDDIGITPICTRYYLVYALIGDARP